ncbi:MAG: Cof-type HAD-IIB family hydrolase [Chloroherpetonaceae bacterium]|nr:Cof-type HAD-IIB family hydrolase [Chthonomonadaceae bacterium]MDW8206735.1 Cof-type HAD-IIB family hydrolase [Chloroherpetonaceae bacterium]
MTRASNPRIRALFLDLDGTLIDEEERISPRVLAAIRAARARGCIEVVCTGRTRFTALPIAEQLAPPLGYAVVSNGAVVVHLQRHETLLHRLLPEPLALQIIHTMVDLGLTPCVYEDALHGSIERSRVLYPPGMSIGEWAQPPRYQPCSYLLEHLPFNPVSVSAFGPAEWIQPRIALLRTRLPETVSAIETGSARTWGVEVYAGGVSKRQGAAMLAEHLGIEREEVMAIGDHRNDIELLQWAGIGVAMGNALPEVIAAADWVTGSVQEDGVAQAIERFVL